MGLRLMEALGTSNAVQMELQEERLPWINRAITVYQVKAFTLLPGTEHCWHHWLGGPCYNTCTS